MPMSMSIIPTLAAACVRRSAVPVLDVRRRSD
jgi:hypothetical protein